MADATSPEHIAPLRTYALVLGALLVLTAVTTGIAFVDLGVLNTPVALAIATLKASIVALYFMHLLNSPRLTTLIAVAAVFWLGILLTLTLSDYLTRSVLRFG